MRVSFDAFDTASWSDEAADQGPIEFVAHPTETLKDYFGREIPRYRVIVLGKSGSPISASG